MCCDGGERYSIPLSRLSKALLRCSSIGASMTVASVRSLHHKQTSVALLAFRLGLTAAAAVVQAALTAVTATHQLVSAIHTLGLCIRPMLLANRPLRLGAAPDMMDTDAPGASLLSSPALAGSWNTDMSWSPECAWIMPPCPISRTTPTCLK